jgi:hypothetical protein
MMGALGKVVRQHHHRPIDRQAGVEQQLAVVGGHAHHLVAPKRPLVEVDRPRSPAAGDGQIGDDARQGGGIDELLGHDSLLP